MYPRQMLPESESISLRFGQALLVHFAAFSYHSLILLRIRLHRACRADNDGKKEERVNNTTQGTNPIRRDMLHSD